MIAGTIQPLRENCQPFEAASKAIVESMTQVITLTNTLWEILRNGRQDLRHRTADHLYAGSTG